MMRKKTTASLIFLFLLAFASPQWAQSGASVQYVYDALGRLTTVVDPSGNVATYNYDAVGNFLSITTSTSSPSALAILGFSPTEGGRGRRDRPTHRPANRGILHGTAAARREPRGRG